VRHWSGTDHGAIYACNAVAPVSANGGDNYTVISFPGAIVHDLPFCPDAGGPVHHQESGVDQRWAGDRRNRARWSSDC